VKNTKAKPQLKKPRAFNTEKGRAIAKRVIEENKAWLKEMAKK
jgi:hypothetical protein